MELLCEYCGYFGEMIYVHSHYQCPRCKNYVVPCCEGEPLNEDMPEEDAKEEEKKDDKDTHK